MAQYCKEYNNPSSAYLQRNMTDYFNGETLMREFTCDKKKTSRSDNQSLIEYIYPSGHGGSCDIQYPINTNLSKQRIPFDIMSSLVPVYDNPLYTDRIIATNTCSQPTYVNTSRSNPIKQESVQCTPNTVECGCSL
jgi:hypothetical protein